VEGENVAKLLLIEKGDVAEDQ